MVNPAEWFHRKKKEVKATVAASLAPRTPQPQSVPDQIDRCLELLSQTFGNTADLATSKIMFGNQPALLVFLSSMTDAKLIAEKIIGPLAISKEMPKYEQNLETYCETMLRGIEYKISNKWQEIIHLMLAGFVALFVESSPCALVLKIQGSSYRSIEEPSTQTIVKGPKDGFTESADVNMSLIRRRILNPALRFESYTLGTETRTPVYLAYIEGIINPGILEEVRIRLNNMQTNAIFDTGIIEEFIADKTLTPFPLTYNTERPDSTAANLITGKVAIIAEGSPFVLILPATFNDFFQVSEDYYQPYMMASFIRIVRYAAFMLSLLLPATYVSIITYHHELLPTQLLISIMAQREGIPFPTVVEALLMELTFEILREAGIRMPRAVGMTVSIVGGLVIGQAAVEAGIISNIMVIIVALTAISSFVSPVYSFSMSSRLLRFSMILLGAFLGLYGVILGLMIMVGHLCSLRSFGIPYLAPLAPLVVADQNDVFIRSPMWAMKKRPYFLHTEDLIKQPRAESPSPPPDGRPS
ncbi:spore germination protein [Brevibacillus migulae]|uniref:spore germination protein n=1 Tax=Brevibacillus migulae TaxID=1644114 RepID=UPI00106E47D7|nr:spore germination protein [Brevibacillus migulae]